MCLFCFLLPWVSGQQSHKRKGSRLFGLALQATRGHATLQMIIMMTTMMMVMIMITIIGSIIIIIRCPEAIVPRRKIFFLM